MHVVHVRTCQYEYIANNSFHSYDLPDRIRTEGVQQKNYPNLATPIESNRLTKAAVYVEYDLEIGCHQRGNPWLSSDSMENMDRADDSLLTDPAVLQALARYRGAYAHLSLLVETESRQ